VKARERLVDDRYRLTRCHVAGGEFASAVDRRSKRVEIAWRDNPFTRERRIGVERIRFAFDLHGHGTVARCRQAVRQGGGFDTGHCLKARE
jgi:hypothetical protein